MNCKLFTSSTILFFFTIPLRQFFITSRNFDIPDIFQAFLFVQYFTGNLSTDLKQRGFTDYLKCEPVNTASSSFKILNSQVSLVVLYFCVHNVSCGRFVETALLLEPLQHCLIEFFVFCGIKSMLLSLLQNCFNFFLLKSKYYVLSS